MSNSPEIICIPQPIVQFHESTTFREHFTTSETETAAQLVAVLEECIEPLAVAKSATYHTGSDSTLPPSRLPSRTSQSAAETASAPIASLDEFRSQDDLFVWVGEGEPLWRSSMDVDAICPRVRSATTTTIPGDTESSLPQMDSAVLESTPAGISVPENTKTDISAERKYGTEAMSVSTRNAQNDEIVAVKPVVAPIKKLLPMISQISFSRLPSKQPIDLRFDNLCYNAKLGFRKGTKKILHELSGRFPPRQLIAIMGPSGAGKSTLLDILSGYRITGVTGSVLVDRQERDLNEFRRNSCYITQDDRLQPLMTVRENMTIASDLKLGPDVKFAQKQSIIDEILTTLGLFEAQHTRAKMISGGQKKRLSIALELINNPLVMFLDEPTTGLDSSSCSQCVRLLQDLARQGRTIVCTVHQPSASLFQLFDQVYVLAQGRCLYQGAANQLVPFLQSVDLPCPIYHNPADYVIELACGEYGDDKIDLLIDGVDNGRVTKWMSPEFLSAANTPTGRRPVAKLPARKGPPLPNSAHLQETTQGNQIKVLLERGFLKTKRDMTMTHLRVLVNIIVGAMLGVLYVKSGSQGDRVLDNYSLLFSILMHHLFCNMMLTILTFPTELSILKKEHFNRWYSLKAYYVSVTLIDIPVTVIGCLCCSVVVYFMSGQPNESDRFFMFFTISLLVVFVAQSVGLMIGAVFNVVNGTFLGPTLAIPVMMFAGFGVNLRDLPPYLYWGTYVSYLRYGLEGYVGAIYGYDRETLTCPDGKYCHYKYPKKFLKEIAMEGEQFWPDVGALLFILVLFRVLAYVLLRWKLFAVR